MGKFLGTVVKARHMKSQELSVNSYVYEAIQRKYRNSVIRHIRATLKAKYRKDWEEEVKKPFKGEWDKIKLNADVYRQTGEISVPVIDTLDYLGVNHFYNLFDLHFDVIFAKAKFPKEISRAPKDAILRWSKAIRNIRDPVSHPAEIDLSILDAIQVVDSARRIVQIFDKTAATEIRAICKLLMNMERGDSEPRRVLDNNLPAPETIVTDFIGRIEELEELYEWFNDTNQKRWMLAGAGGKGKTAIAYKFATQIKNSAPDFYTMVLWLSAKKRKFMEGSIVPIDHPDFMDLDSALNKLLIDFGWGETIHEPVNEKTDLLLKLLDEFPVFIIVDDIDTLQAEEDEAVAFFTFEVPHTRSKVLFTSRTRFPGMNKCTTQVEGFSIEEAEEYIDIRLKNYFAQNTQLSREDVIAVNDVTEGSPLYIDELLRLHATGMPLNECITNWKEMGDTARDFSLRREFESLSNKAQKVLLACCINREPSTVSDLEVVTKLSQSEVFKTIDELSKLFLVPRPFIIEGVPRFDVNLNTRLLVIDGMSSYGAFADIQSAFKSLHGEIMSSGKRRADIRAYQRQVIANVDANRQYDAEKLLQDKALAEYPNDPDLLGQLGWVYLRWQPESRIEDARSNFLRAAKLNCRNPSMYWQWWRMEADRGNWAMAIDACRKGVKNCPNNMELQYCLGYSHSRSGKSLELQFQYSRAQDEFHKAALTLEKALDAVRNVAVKDYKLLSQIYRALIIAYQAMILYIDPKLEKNKEEALKSQIKAAFINWESECPDDDYMTSEKKRLEEKYPELLL